MTRRCARCGRQQPAERMLFSRHTRNRYCADLDGCARRARKKTRRRDEVAA